jgi:hypothetical protein
VIAFLLALVLGLFADQGGHAAPAAAVRPPAIAHHAPPAAGVVPQPTVPAHPEQPAAVGAPADHGVTVPPPDTAAPGCGAGEEWQGEEFGCVAVQLPDETTGRAYG